MWLCVKKSAKNFIRNDQQIAIGKKAFCRLSDNSCLTHGPPAEFGYVHEYFRAAFARRLPAPCCTLSPLGVFRVFAPKKNLVMDVPGVSFCSLRRGDTILSPLPGVQRKRCAFKHNWNLIKLLAAFYNSKAEEWTQSLNPKITTGKFVNFA
jgi:hypothetical protein